MEGVKDFEPHRLDFEQENRTELTSPEDPESLRLDLEEENLTGNSASQDLESFSKWS